MKIKFKLKGQDKKFSRYIINPEANLEIAEILDYLLKVYHDYGWSFIEEQHQCSFMCSNFYNLVKELEPELFKELKTKYPPGLQVAHGLFRSGEKGTYRMIHSWVKLGPVIVDPTYKQFFKNGRVDKFDDMIKRYERKPSILNPDDFYGFEMGTEKAEFLLKKLREKFKKPNYTYKNFKSMHLFSWEVDQIINEFNLKGQDSKVYSGEEVANYMQDITPSEENIPTYYANIAKKHNFKLIKIPTNELIDKYIGNDVGAMEYIEGSSDRYTGSDFNGFYDQDYNQIDISEEDLYNPIVIIEGELLDGYSRVKQHLKRNIDHIMAYINVKE